MLTLGVLLTVSDHCQLNLPTGCAVSNWSRESHRDFAHIVMPTARITYIEGKTVIRQSQSAWPAYCAMANPPANNDVESCPSMTATAPSGPTSQSNVPAVPSNVASSVEPLAKPACVSADKTSAPSSDVPDMVPAAKQSCAESVPSWQFVI
jgi:hypothetical protein